MPTAGSRLLEFAQESGQYPAMLREGVLVHPDPDLVIQLGA